MIDDLILDVGNPEQIKAYFQQRKLIFSSYNKMINFISNTNLYSKAGVKPENLQELNDVRTEIIMNMLTSMEENKLSCVNVLYPTDGYAQRSRIPYSRLVNMLNNSISDDHGSVLGYCAGLEKHNSDLIEFLKDSKTIRIVGEDTDLTLKVEGQKWINGSGKINIPDGEVFTAPIKESVNGHIKFDYSIVYDSEELSDIWVEFENGKISDFNCSCNKTFERLISSDAGSCYLGEIGFGTNFKLDKFIGNIIFDEKIGGTVHLALGSAFPQCGDNKSCIHMDMIKDTSSGTKVYVDDKLFLTQRAYTK